MAEHRQPELFFLMGLPGAGKSVLANRLRHERGWVHVDSDLLFLNFPQTFVAVAEALYPFLPSDHQKVFRSLGRDEEALSRFFKGNINLLTAPYIDAKLNQLVKEAAILVSSTRSKVVVCSQMFVKSERIQRVKVARSCAVNPVVVEVTASLEALLRTAQERIERASLDYCVTPPNELVLAHGYSSSSSPSLNEGWERVYSYSRDQLNDMGIEEFERRILMDGK